MTEKKSSPSHDGFPFLRLDILGFFERLQRSKTMAAAAELFKETIAPLDFVVFACGEIDLENRDRNLMFMAEWPPEWLQYYRSSGFIERDPILNALRIQREPFTFGDIVRDRRFSKLDRVSLRVAAENGWARGFAAPFPRGGAHIGLVTMLGRAGEMEDALRVPLTIISHLLLSHVRRIASLGDFAMPPMGLSPRQIEALRLVCKGCSDEEIANALKIAKPTAHAHVEQARRRLAARNRAHMAALGVAFGLIEAQ
jgi:DNA-binding CsgD family transcriptional regulator